MKFRNFTEEDLPTLIELENKGFTPEEAATPEAIEQRIEIIPDTFIIAEQDGEIAGYINGPVIPNNILPTTYLKRLDLILISADI